MDWKAKLVVALAFLTAVPVIIFVVMVTRAAPPIEMAKVQTAPPRLKDIGSVPTTQERLVLREGITGNQVRAVVGAPAAVRKHEENGVPVAVWDYANGGQVFLRDGLVESWRAPEPVRAPESVVGSSRESPKEGANRRLQGLLDTHAVARVDLQLHRVWIDPALWATLNRDQKQNVIDGLAGEFEILTGSPYVEVLSYSDDASLGKFGVFGAKLNR